MTGISVQPTCFRLTNKGMVVEEDLCVPSLSSVLFQGIRFSISIWYSPLNLSCSQIKVEDERELKSALPTNMDI